MLRTLLESNASRERHHASTAASVAVHTAVIAAAIVATASARTEKPRQVIGPPLVFVDSRSPSRTPVARAPVRRPSQRSSLSDPVQPPVGPRWAVEFAPKLPPNPGIDFDVRRLLGADSTIVGARSWAPRGSLGGELQGPLGSEPATVATVDRPAALLAPPPRPRYPDPLRGAGVTGRVVVRLVVDTAGRVEPRSVVVRESSHDLFAQSVRAVLPTLRFRPAEVGGRRVRMLVELPFEFRLNE